MPVKIKICGIRRTEDALILNEFPPDYCGFILSSGYKRTVLEKDFYALTELISKDIKRVGVFVDEDINNLLRLAPYLDVIQLHGSEDNDYIKAVKQNTKIEVWKAVRAKSVCDIEKANELSADKLLVDSFVQGMVGGTGKTLDYELVKKAIIKKPFFAAGGISADNAKEIINNLSPFGIDLSGSVETDGVKDREKIKEIITLLRRINNNG